MTELIKKVEQWSEDRGFFEEGSGVTFEAQFLKLYEEFGELCGSIVKGKDVKDDIGDNLVVLINLAKIRGFSIMNMTKRLVIEGHERIFLFDAIDYAVNLGAEKYPLILHDGDEKSFIGAYIALSLVSEESGVDIKECLEIAYNEIKDRKGKMINGAFIKEGDL